MKNQDIYYVYGYIDPVTKQLFYIGKGHDNRYRHIETRKSNKHLYNKLKKLKENYDFNEFTIFFKMGLMEQEAYNEEISLIALYGRLCEGTGTLLNITSGGEGIDSKTITAHNLKRVKNGTHPFLNRDTTRKNAIRRVKEGTHNFLGGEVSRRINKKRVEDGTHHFFNNTGDHLRKPFSISSSDGREWKFNSRKDAKESGFSLWLLECIILAKESYTVKRDTRGNNVTINFKKGDIITYSDSAS